MQGLAFSRSRLSPCYVLRICTILPETTSLSRLESCRQRGTAPRNHALNAEC